MERDFPQLARPRLEEVPISGDRGGALESTDEGSIRVCLSFRVGGISMAHIPYEIRRSLSMIHPPLITLLDATSLLKQLKSFRRFRIFYFASVFNCIVQVVMLGAMGDTRRWMDLYFVVGSYFVFVLTVKRKRAAECDCVNATTVSREFLSSVDCHNNDDKMHCTHVDTNLNRIYRNVDCW